MSADEELVIVTPGVADEMGEYAEHRKIALTRISLFTVPPGTTFMTSEGLTSENEPCRIAFDVAGNVYPIRESVFQASYERVR